LAWRLPPRKFEEIVAEILCKQGFSIELTPASGDGGFDIYAARRDGLGSFLYLVECKRYVPPNKVGVEVVRSLYGVIQTQRATAGAIVTTSYFTAGAQEFQRQVQYQMHLHDYLVLQRWIKDFPITRSAETPQYHAAEGLHAAAEAER
jgi:restriction system protein